MQLIKKILLLSFSSLLCISCNQSNSDSCGTAWIGGEVVNPKTDYVIISQGRHIIDTVPLDNQNFFIYQLKQVDPGVYNFSHFEYQVLFIEPGDSIMLRVNTKEFDESLSYTGRGAHKNNFMMDLFLMNEKENEMMPTMYLLPPAEFVAKTDSFTEIRRKLYNEFVDLKNPSQAFKEVAEACIDYDIYSKKELYISANARKQIYDESVEIPEDFYDFRKNVNFGNEQLRSYYPYYRYLRYYFDNLAYEKYKSTQTYDRNSFLHNYHKSAIIDSLVTDEDLKNRLLRTSAYRYFLHAESKENAEKMLDRFLTLSTNTEDHEKIGRLALAAIHITPGHTIPNVMLLTTDNTVKDLHSIINRPTVLYFWSDKSVSHNRSIHLRAKELSAKYPEYDYVAINIDSHFKKWLKNVSNSDYDRYNEYQFENFSDAEMKLIIDSVNKAIVLDSEGIIWNGNTNIFDISIEDQLLGFLNK